jgi:hypothetical protein
MPPVVITYNDRIAWGSPGTNFRNSPHTSIQVHGPAPGGVPLHGPTGRGVPLWGLLDTGADHLMVEKSVAKQIGIDDLSTYPKTMVRVASGASIPCFLVDVEITMIGRRFVVPAVFGISNATLIGRSAILTGFDFGIDGLGWLHT